MAGRHTPSVQGSTRSAASQMSSGLGLIDMSMRRQVAFVMKMASRLTTEWSTVMTMWRQRLICDIQGDESQGRLCWTTTSVMATTVMVRDWATLTYADDWTVTRPSVDDVRASTGRCWLSSLESVQRRWSDGTVRELNSDRRQWTL